MRFNKEEDSEEEESSKVASHKLGSNNTAIEWGEASP